MNKQVLPWFQIAIVSLFLLFGLGVGSVLAPRPVTGQSWLFLTLLGTGMALIGFSLLLGTLAKFFKRFQPILHFRKQLGVTGFAYLVILTLVMIPVVVANPLWTEVYRSVGITWLVALLLFFGCTYISRASMIKQLGANRWRFLLRTLSYAGFALVLVALYSVYCVNCLQSGAIPPGADIALVWLGFGVLVFAVRGVLFVYDLVYENLAKNEE
jgi:DMSO/TMAO reductase YedYZ heme-binding membrane subunit